MRAFRTDMERALTSIGYGLAVLGTILALLAGAFHGLWVNSELVETQGLVYGYHWQLLKQGLQSEAYIFAVPIISTLGFGGAYLEEMKSGYYKFALPRYGRKTYAVVKVIVSILTGMLAVWLGVLLTALIYWLVYAPMELNAVQAEQTGRVAAVLYEYADGAIRTVNGEIAGVEVSGAVHSPMIVALLQWSAMAGLMGGVWAGIGCMFAILYQNRYMAYGASFLTSYLIIIIITRFFDKLYIWNPREWFRQSGYWQGGNLGVMMILAEWIIILAILDLLIMRRRLAPY